MAIRGPLAHGQWWSRDGMAAGLVILHTLVNAHFSFMESLFWKYEAIFSHHASLWPVLMGFLVYLITPTLNYI